MQHTLRALALSALLAPAFAGAATIVSCPANTTSSGGDNIGRSFYLPNYGGTTLDTVTVNYGTGATGSYTISLEARLNSFDGTLVGTATSTATVTANTFGGVPVTFNFNNAAIPANSTITFKQTLVSGPGGLSNNTGQAPCTGSVTQTNGSTPPLDSARRATLAITVTGSTTPVGGGSGTVASIPTLSEWGVILMSGLLAMFGIARMRRRGR